MDAVTPRGANLVAMRFDPYRVARLQDWRVIHEVFLLEQAFDPLALPAARSSLPRTEAYQLVPAPRALHVVRPWLVRANDLSRGKDIRDKPQDSDRSHGLPKTQTRRTFGAQYQPEATAHTWSELGRV